jgi:hypothetical protein
VLTFNSVQTTQVRGSSVGLTESTALLVDESPKKKFDKIEIKIITAIKELKGRIQIFNKIFI